MISSIQKMRHLAQEMELAHLLATHGQNDFICRTLSRHILVRAKDFISISRGIRKPLNKAGFDTKEFHAKKESYADHFDEYFQTTRDKLSGHVQDLDFGLRIELWNNVEVVKVHYFCEGAREIYDCLEALSIPGYEPFKSFSETTDEKFLAILSEIKNLPTTPGVEIGSDMLSITRPNSVAALNFTPVHQRAQQLKTIERWIDISHAFLNTFRDFSSASNILKSRLLTDIVSYVDCLLTRSDAGVMQQMDGLDKLLDRETEEFKKFFAVYNYREILGPFRLLRNKFGGHLDVDLSLKEILKLIDELDVQLLLSFHSRLRGIFARICKGVVYLTTYLSDGQRIYGVALDPKQSSVSKFDDKSEGDTVHVLAQPDWNDIARYNNDLKLWIDCKDGDARHYFWNAWSFSDVVEEIKIEEPIGTSGKRMYTRKFKKVHLFLLNQLCSATDLRKSIGILELIESCANNDPKMCVEVLKRYLGNPNKNLPIYRVYQSIGRVCPEPYIEAKEILQTALSEKDFHSKLAVRIEYFRIHAKGCRGKKSELSPDQFFDQFEPILDGLDEFENLLLQIVWASLFFDQVSGFGSDLIAEFEMCHEKLEQLIVVYTTKYRMRKKSDLFDRLLANRDYSGVCLLLGDLLYKGKKDARAKLLFEFVADEWVYSLIHSDSKRHHICCLLRVNRPEEAIEKADILAYREPSEPFIQLFFVHVLLDTGRIGPAIDYHKMLKKEYKLKTSVKKYSRQLFWSILWLKIKSFIFRNSPETLA